MVKASDLEKAVKMFPEIKEFVDYVTQTGGLETLKVENERLMWHHERSEGDYFYTMELMLDRNNPSMWIYFRERMIGTDPFSEPAKGEELIKKLPELFREMKLIYDKCFIKDENIYRY